MKAESRRSRRLWCGAGLVATIVLVGLTHAPLLQRVASFLIVEDSLEQAAAIVVMGGQSPFREMEAAKIYRAGLAPSVVVARGIRWEEQQTLRKLGVKVPEGWETSREVLLRLGVPLSAIIVPADRAEGTLEELQVAAKALHPNKDPVILVSSTPFR